MYSRLRHQNISVIAMKGYDEYGMVVQFQLRLQQLPSWISYSINRSFVQRVQTGTPDEIHFGTNNFRSGY